MIFHTVIIDHEPDSIKALRLLIEKFIPELKIVAGTTNALEGIDIINNYRPDVVFLEINMPVLNGFQLLDNLSYNQFYLIFTAAHAQHGLKAIKKGAFDYLLKPIGINDVRETAARIVKQTLLVKQQERLLLRSIEELILFDRLRIPVPTKEFTDYVFSNEIIYIEAKTHFSVVSFTNGTTVSAAKPLKEYELLLCKANEKFIRIHNSYIINTNYITRYLKEDGGFVLMQGNKKIPISKYKKDHFLRVINLSAF